MPLRGHFVIQLPHRTAAEIAGIFVFGVYIIYFLVDPFKIRVIDNRLPADNQLSLIRNPQGEIDKGFCIICDYLADNAVSAGYRLLQNSVPVSQNDGQPVHFPGQECFVPADKAPKLLHVFSLIQRKHGRFMPLFGKGIHRLIPYPVGRRVGQNHSRFLFQTEKLIVQSIIFIIAHDFPVLGIIGLCRPVQGVHKLPHSFFLIFHSSLLLCAPGILRYSCTAASLRFCYSFPPGCSCFRFPSPVFCFFPGFAAPF